MFYGTNQAKRENGQAGMSDETTDAAATAKRDVVTAAQEVLNQAQEKLTGLAQQGRRASRQVDTYAHEHVWTTVAIAAAIGAVIGIFLSRDRR